MQCEEKPRKIQIQALADELQKAETEYLVEEECKEVGSGYHVRYFTRMTVSICGPCGNNSASDWIASSLLHCACTNSTPVTEPGEANKPWSHRI